MSLTIIIESQPSHAIYPKDNSNHERYTPRAYARIANGLLASVARRPRNASLACLMLPLFRAAQAANPVAYGGGVQTCSYRRKAPGRSHQPRGGYRGTPSPSRTKVSRGGAGAQYLFDRREPPESPVQTGAAKRAAVYNSHQACIRQKPDGLPRLDQRDLLAKFHQPIGIDQR
jgi:hypothetical protein